MPTSSQGFTGKEIILILGFIAGILAALAWSAARKVRASSQDSLRSRTS